MGFAVFLEVVFEVVFGVGFALVSVFLRVLVIFYYVLALFIVQLYYIMIQNSKIKIIMIN